MPTCTILIGIPGAGKSTWIRNNISTEERIISPDTHLEEKYNYQWTPERASEAWAVSYHQFASCLQAGQSVVWDATFLRPIDRSAILHLSNGFGYHTKAVVLVAPLEVCLERNKRRKREPVPSEKIIAMHEALCIPEVSEGFNEIVIVSQD